MLPFGLSSAPKIFNSVADALAWILERAGIPVIRHYADDYIIIATPDAEKCQEYLDRVCGILGVPLAVHKCVGPTSCIIFLGIIIDTDAPAGQEVPALDCPIGGMGGPQLVHTQRARVPHQPPGPVVRLGRSFMRRMLDLLHAVHRPPSSTVPIRLSQWFRSDLAWWQEFLPPLWNGVSFLPPPSLLPKT